MTTRTQSSPPFRRVQVFFFTMFLPVGMINAYAGIWFADRGLSDFQIGLLGSVPTVLVLLTTLFVGRLADRASDWRQVIVLGCVGAGVLPMALFFTDGVWPILIVWTALTVSQRLTIPVADAAAIRMARREGHDFGRVRALATAGYLLVVIGAGFALGDAGIALFLPLFVIFSLIRTGAAFGLPRMRGDVAATPSQGFTAFPQMRQMWFVLPVLGWALIDATNLILNSFQGLLWARQGISTQTIGLLITLGAAAEAVMFYLYWRLAPRFSARALLIAAAGAAMIRWVGMALEPGVPVLVALQLLHAFTYAMGFLACTSFIADHTAEENAAEAQSFLALLAMSASAVAILIFGALAGPFGAGAYLFSVVVAALGGLAVFVARPPSPPVSRQKDHSAT